MKLSEFIALSQEQKKITVMSHGVAIAKRYLDGKLVFLFQLGEYYVEAYCCCTSKDILEYRVFHNTKHLSPYLDAIPIEDLLK